MGKDGDKDYTLIQQTPTDLFVAVGLCGVKCPLQNKDGLKYHSDKTKTMNNDVNITIHLFIKK